MHGKQKNPQIKSEPAFPPAKVIILRKIRERCKTFQIIKGQLNNTIKDKKDSESELNKRSMRKICR